MDLAHGSSSYHIGLDGAHGARYAILPGDPGRVESIAALLDRPRFLAQNREYTSWIGELLGDPVLVTSTGIGGSSAAICVEELYMAGVRNFVRVGTCGGMAPEVAAGDIVIANAAIRMDGVTKEYVPAEFPAVADISVTNALIAASRGRGAVWHCGIVHCKDSFYGQHSPERMPIGHELREKWRAWIAAGCLASEMESSAVFIVSQILRARAGCVLSALWNQELRPPEPGASYKPDTEAAVKIAVDAVRILIQDERAPQPRTDGAR